MTNNESRHENQSTAGRWTAPPDPDAVPVADSAPDSVPEVIPKAAVVAWAAGPSVAPSGRHGKKMRRRTRKIAAALAVIFVMSTVGTTTAVAQNPFYKASPYVKNQQLVDAGAKSFDERLAIGEPEKIPGAPVAATNLEDAILSGSLSQDKMEIPDMMLAGMSGDEMARAAADDDSNPASDDAADERPQPDGGPEPEEQAAGPADAATDAGDTGGDSTVGDLAKNSADENPNGYASPALGGDPEPIVDEYAKVEGGSGGEPEAYQNPVPQPPTNTELVDVDPVGADTGTDAPTEPPVMDDGSQPEVDREPDETPQPDELAVIPPPESDEGDSEAEPDPTDHSVPAGTTPEEPTTDEPTTDEPTTERAFRGRRLCIPRIRCRMVSQTTSPDRLLLIHSL